jgi:hypothetical protein
MHLCQHAKHVPLTSIFSTHKTYYLFVTIIIMGVKIPSNLKQHKTYYVFFTIIMMGDNLHSVI